MPNLPGGKDKPLDVIGHYDRSTVTQAIHAFEMALDGTLAVADKFRSANMLHIGIEISTVGPHCHHMQPFVICILKKKKSSRCSWKRSACHRTPVELSALHPGQEQDLSRDCGRTLDSPPVVNTSRQSLATSLLLSCNLAQWVS